MSSASRATVIVFTGAALLAATAFGAGKSTTALAGLPKTVSYNVIQIAAHEQRLNTLEREVRLQRNAQEQANAAVLCFLQALAEIDGYTFQQCAAKAAALHEVNGNGH